MNIEEAKKLVSDYVNNKFIKVLKEDDEIVILDEQILTLRYGWVFYYDTKKFIETEKIKYMILDNHPLLVLKDTGKIMTILGYLDLDEELQRIEKKFGL